MTYRNHHPITDNPPASEAAGATPIVDAALVLYAKWCNGRSMQVWREGDPADGWDTARTLERDLTAARQRIEGLEESIGLAQKGFEAMTKYAEDWKGACESAESRLAEVEAKAARYEWLKNQQRMAYGDTAVINWNIGHDWERINSENLDAAIDSAIRHLKEKS